jgi:hypothetical protein
VKESPKLELLATLLFADSGIQIQHGARDLGGAIGSTDFVTKFLGDKIAEFTSMVETLATIAKTQPQAAHAGYTHGLRGMWAYPQRVISCSAKSFQPLETAIRDLLIPAIFGTSVPISDEDRLIFSLPTSDGGLSIGNPVVDCILNHSDSLALTAPLRKLILSCDSKYSVKSEDIKCIKATIKLGRIKNISETKVSISETATLAKIRAIDNASEKGASSVFSVLPLDKLGYSLIKKDYLIA